MAASAAGTLPLAPSRASSAASVRAWLFFLAALVVAMVAVGGATRLTGSGLSITEWKPVTGAIPPLSEAAWLAEFEKYRAIPQYQLLNKGMSLGEFKTIYFWEWGHRQLGRFLGLAFFLPLAWFWLRGAVTNRFALVLLGIGALGGLQAAVGWIMVASGLKPGMVAVAPVKLMLHLTIASVIFALLVWVATGLRERPAGKAEASVSRKAPAVLLGLVFLQIALGALVAGSKAGLTYNTWPLMDGEFVPAASALFVVQPFIENFVDNPTLVQFNHRMTAYALVAFALWHAWSLARRAPSTGAGRRARVLAGLMVAQMALGIVTLLLAVPLWAGLAHQVFAMAVLGMAVVHLRLAGPAR
ncbi:MAG TPA: COX15/CtaA family protein [Microvirga sp.]|jgi:cytochrome c oxidase assembly protein subunit 15|nr:COX15/CtaA family protein [Microvirga sp.]